MKKRVLAILLVTALLLGAFMGAGIGFQVGRNEEMKSELTTELTPDEEKRFATYLHLPSENGLEVHFWKRDGEIVGMILPAVAREETEEDLQKIRQKSLTLPILSKIVRRYPNASVSVRSSEGLSEKELNWARAYCFIS